MSGVEDFQLRVVAVDAYAPPLSPLPATESADRLARLLQGWGAGVPKRASPTTCQYINAFLHEWAVDTEAAPSSFVYWAGHGFDSGTDHWLYASETTAPASRANSIPASDLAEYLILDYGRREEHPDAWTVLVLDCCGSAVGVTNITNALTRNAPVRPRRCMILPVAEEGGSFAGRFVEKLEEALAALTPNDESIAVQELVLSVINRLGGDVQPDGFLPASAQLRRREPAEGPITVTLDAFAELRSVVARLPDTVQSHFFPKAKGADAHEPAWYFSGRERELGMLSDWTAEAASGMLVVTGAPGSGKSALLGRLLTLAEPELVDALEDVAPAGPAYRGIEIPPKAFDAALHLTGMTSERVESAIADALHVDEGSLRKHLRGAERVTVVADALDEALEPVAIARTLRQLADLPSMRMIVGTRTGLEQRLDQPDSGDDGLLRALAPSTTVVVERQPAAVESYVRRRLGAPSSAYRELDIDVDSIASRIRERDQPFLYARLVTGELLAREPLQAGDLTLESLLGANHRQVFAGGVERLRREDPAYRPLLEALAFARGRGLPRSLMPTVASALHPDVDVSDAVVDRFLEAAAPYVTLDGEAGQSVYRLSHQTFAEHLRAARPAGSQTDLAIGSALVSAIERTGGWPAANAYSVRYVPEHLVDDTRRLEAVCTDADYLRRAIEALGVDGLHALLAAAVRDSGSAAIGPVAAAIRRCRVALQRNPGELGPQLVARLAGLDDVAHLLDAIDERWPGTWLRARSASLEWDEDLHGAMTFHGKPRAVAFGDFDHRQVVGVGVGTWVALWDPRSGNVELLHDAGFRPTTVAVGQVAGHPVVAAAGIYEGKLGLLELDRSRWRQLPVPVPPGAQIAIGTVEGREAVVLAGDWGCAVHDASTGDLILSDAVPTLALTNAASGVMLLRHAPVGYAVVPLGRTSSTEYRLPDPSELPDLPLMALGEGESSLLLAVVSRLGSGSVWNLRTGRRVGDVQFDIEVRAIAVSAVDRRTLVVAINDTDQEGGFVMSREATPVSLRRAAVARRPVRGVVGVGLVGEALVALERSGDTLELRSVPDGRPLPYDDEAVRVVAGESVEHQTAALPRVSRMGLGEVRVERPEEWPPTASAVGELGGRKVIVRGSYGGVVVVFDATTGELVAAVQTELPQTVHLGTKGGPSAVSDVAVGSDLIAAAYEGSVLLFDVGLERLPSDWIDAVAVRAVAVGAIGARMAVVATGGDGGGLRLWDVATRTRVASITLDVAVRRVWLCGGVVVASTADGMLHAFDVRDRDARRAQPRD